MHTDLVGRTIGPYRLRALLGRGGMGTVYRAFDERLKRHVAVKHVRPDRDAGAHGRQRLLREARAAAALTHPAIVQVYDVVEGEAGDWIVMELASGQTLAEQLRRGPLAVPDAVRLAREVAGGLAHAHDRGVIHRDLKTENVMVTADGHAKILDFGLAKRPLDADESLTATGTVLGTTRAMSPEQAQGLAVDARSDLFSLGVLLYEVVTGISPFDAPSDVATLTRVCTHAQEPIVTVRPDVPAALSVLVDHLLAKVPAFRPRDAEEVAGRLATIERALAPPLASRGIGAETDQQVWAMAETLDASRIEDVRIDPESRRPAGVVGRGDGAPEAAAPARRSGRRAVRPAARGAKPGGWWLGRIAALVVLVGILGVVEVGPRLRDVVIAWLQSTRGPEAATLRPSFEDSEAARAPASGITEPVRLVVLPFENQGPARDAYFAAGVTDEIARRLSLVGGLAVVSQTTAARFHALGLSIGEIGRQLDVGYVLEGAVTWPASDDPAAPLRITPRLVPVAGDTQVWSAAYERTLEDALAVQTEIAAAVATRLDLGLRQGERRALVSRGTEVSAAYFSYLRGLDYRRQPHWSTANQRKAARLFEHATELDGSFVEAYVELARVHAVLFFNNDASAQRGMLAAEALRDAQALDPGHLAVRIAEGYHLFQVESDYEVAVRVFEGVLIEVPQNVDALMGLGLAQRRHGRFGEAVDRLESSFSLDRANPRLAWMIGEIYRAMRRGPEADRWFRLALELAPDLVSALGDRAVNLMAWQGCVGLVATAEDCSTVAARRLLEESPLRDEPELYRYWMLLDLYDAGTAPTEAERERWFRSVVSRMETQPVRAGGPGRGCSYFWLEALALEAVGRKAEAESMVDQCRQEGEAVIQERPEAHPYMGRLAIAYAYLGWRGDALAMFEAIEALDVRDRFSGPRTDEYMAIASTFLGDADRAVELLEPLVETPYRNAVTGVDLRLNPVWHPLRNRTDFQKLIVQTGFGDGASP